MQMIRSIVVGLSAVTLCGCAVGQAYVDGAHALVGYSPEELASRKAKRDAADDAQCRGYGAKLGTPEYVQCRVSLANQRSAASAGTASSGPRQTTCTTIPGLTPQMPSTTHCG